MVVGQGLQCDFHLKMFGIKSHNNVWGEFPLDSVTYVHVQEVWGNYHKVAAPLGCIAVRPQVMYIITKKG